MRASALALVVVVAACKAKAGKHEAAANGCDLAGQYRTRFDTGVGQWLWFRFKVDPSVQHATLTAPYAIDEKATLAIDPDPAACKLAVTATTQRGELLASITLDPKTQKVTGKLRMVGAREGVELEGVHDPGQGAPASKRACIQAGRYQLVVPAEQAWKAADKGSCDNAVIKIPFLVEEFGDQLSIDQLDDDGNAAWAAEDFIEKGPCEVLLRFRHKDYTVMTTLTFGGDKVTAAPEFASVQILDKGDTRRCEISDPMAWVEHVGA